jgi:hypothetical protein
MPGGAGWGGIVRVSHEAGAGLAGLPLAAVPATTDGLKSEGCAVRRRLEGT